MRINDRINAGCSGPEDNGLTDVATKGSCSQFGATRCLLSAHQRDGLTMLVFAL